MNEQNEPIAGTFEIGLVMAGAISAGAYTAGVISFLMEALDAWYREKKAGNGTVPQHDVMIKAISGTSAGGMTAGILGLSLFRDIPVVSNPEFETHSQNPLFDAWVNMADINGLLRLDDRYENQLISLLDSSLLDRIADRIFKCDLSHQKRPYIDPALHLILCMTNLRGMPYNLPFLSDVDCGHQMTMHADHLHFVMTEKNEQEMENVPEFRGTHRLNPFDKSDEAWGLLRQGCLASGAFPLGLASRKMVVDKRKYDGRIMQVPLDVPADTGQSRTLSISQEREIKPDWPDCIRDELSGSGNYTFWASDGGLINNEPFELTRKVLARGDARLERGELDVRRMVIMIDPFVGRNDNAFVDDTAKRPSFASVALDILEALRSQARFKADELALAWDPKVNSRFLIAPTRWSNNVRLTSDRAIASGALGGFSGFLDRSFRFHDYLLGRRNCQKFLRDRLVLEVKPGEINKVFGIDYAEAEHKGWIQWQEKENRHVLPIIPLVDGMDTDPGRPDWPDLDPDRFDIIAEHLAPRLDLIVRKLSDPMRWHCRVPLRTIWWLGLRWKTWHKTMEIIKNDLISRDLWKTL